MNTNNMKNMVVIKDLPSNIVEEAIIILKPNIKLKSLDILETKKESKKVNKSKKQNQKRYIINEAQMVISDYLTKMENKRKNEIKINKKIEAKYKRIKIVSIFLGILLFLSILR